MIEKKNDLAIIVQSTDKYSDCWKPFFELFKIYWPKCKYPIVLNTESKTYRDRKMEIKVIRSEEYYKNNFPTWSQMLKHALENIDEKLVLLILDDMFITDYVDVEVIDLCIEEIKRKDYSSITLTEHGRMRPSKKERNNPFREIEKNAKYRLSTSPTIWKKEILESYIEERENAWQFEVYGSRRARRRKDKMMIVDESYTINGEKGVIPYFKAFYDTAIVHGKWQKEVKAFLDKHNIEMDYEKRGYYKRKNVIMMKLWNMKKMIFE